MFKDDFDRRSFCDLLAASIAKHTWACGAFVLMPTHFHLIVRVEDGVLPRGMHALFGPYAQSFNRRWGRSGHLRAAPYKLRRLYDDRAMRIAARYIARNPVRAKLCDRVGDWEWSSFPDTVGYRREFRFVEPTTVLDAFHEDASIARELFRDFVEEL